MKHILRVLIGGTIIACLGLAAQTAAFAQVTNSNSPPITGKGRLSIRDSAYLRHSAEANLLAAKIGQLAAEKGSTPEIKEWGQKIAQQHNDSYQELSRIAQSKGMTIPTTLDSRHQRTLDKLAARTGADFDKAVLQHSVKTDEVAVRSTEGESKHGEDPEVKQFATTALPTLQADLKQAQTLVAQVGSATHEPAGAQKP